MDEAAGTADADPALVDEPDAPAGKGANVKVGGEDAEIEFRRCCRRFYSGAVGCTLATGVGTGDSGELDAG